MNFHHYLVISITKEKNQVPKLMYLFIYLLFLSMFHMIFETCLYPIVNRYYNNNK